MGDSECESCKISNGQSEVEGGILKLGSYWMINHYQHREQRFLGWLILQPIKHRMTSSEMTTEELEEFGVVSQKLENALMKAYNTIKPNDHAEITYLIRMGESTLEEPREWHLHWHMIPRTNLMRLIGVSEWNIHQCRKCGIKQEPTTGDIEELVSIIRESLQ